MFLLCLKHNRNIILRSYLAYAAAACSILLQRKPIRFGSVWRRTLHQSTLANRGVAWCQTRPAHYNDNIYPETITEHTLKASLSSWSLSASFMCLVIIVKNSVKSMVPLPSASTWPGHDKLEWNWFKHKLTLIAEQKHVAKPVFVQQVC